MKLDHKRTVLVGLAFLSICAFWQMYDNIIPLILTNTFQGTKQEIEMTAYRRKNMFFLTIWNSFNGTLIRQGEKIKTSKPDLAKHGLGLRNIEACAEKYLGRAEIKTEDGQFELTVMLQGRE